MALVRDAFCSYCGTAFAPPLAYPRRCASCKTEIWANPIPVSVILVPIVSDGRTGLLVVRRGIPPGVGQLALVGGFLEEHETWQQGGAREIREETNVTVDPKALTPFSFTSTEPRPNRVLLFSLAAPLQRSEVAPFVPNHETQERGLIFGAEGLEALFVFPLHAQMARHFFAEQKIVGAPDFQRL